MRTHHLPLAIALATSLLASAAHAQSSYAMTTLSTPASSFGFAATAMDNSGRVAGFIQYRDGTLYPSPGDLGALGSCLFGCAVYSVRTVNWPAGTTTTATATNGINSFIASTLTNSGSMFGLSMQNKLRKTTLTIPVTPGNIEDYGYQFFNPVYPKAAVNGETLFVTDFQDHGVSQSGVVFGNSYVFTPGDPSVGGATIDRLPTTWQNGVLTSIPVPAPYVAGRYTAMNTTGGAAGVVSVDDLTTKVNAVWFGGNFSLMNLPATYQAVSMNDAGQILMQQRGTSARASVWFNGAATAINGNGKRVFATAMNSSGVVVGCTQNVVTTPKRSDNTAFIWTNGVLQDLSQVLTSKGVKLPSGTRLGCPVALNDSGSILAYYYRTSSVNTVTWVRFTAKP